MGGSGSALVPVQIDPRRDGREAASRPSLRGFRPCPEDSRPQAHAGGTFFDGHLEVMRHAHGEIIHADPGKLPGGDAVAEFPQSSEVGAGGLGIVGEGRNGHETLNLELRPIGCRLEQLPKLL